MKILIIGAGNMGKTYMESFLREHLLQKEDLMILEKLPERTQELQAEGYTQVYHQPDTWLDEVFLIILAVKPQDIEALFTDLGPYLNRDVLILSIMAGIQMQTISAAFPQAKVIRAMPNLPAQIGLGMTGFTAQKEVNRQELFIVQNLLNTTGKTIYFEKEEQLDAVTAISGSGPAYVFYFMEAMLQEAMQMGFKRSEAELMVEQTFLGAIRLVQKGDLNYKDWIQKVSSKGGTTEAAIKKFNESELQENIQKGVNQAFERAKFLGNQS